MACFHVLKGFNLSFFHFQTVHFPLNKRWRARSFCVTISLFSQVQQWDGLVHHSGKNKTVCEHILFYAPPSRLRLVHNFSPEFFVNFICLIVKMSVSVSWFSASLPSSHCCLPFYHYLGEVATYTVSYHYTVVTIFTGFDKSICEWDEHNFI